MPEENERRKRYSVIGSDGRKVAETVARGEAFVHAEEYLLENKKCQAVTVIDMSRA